MPVCDWFPYMNPYMNASYAYTPYIPYHVSKAREKNNNPFVPYVPPKNVRKSAYLNLNGRSYDKMVIDNIYKYKEVNFDANPCNEILLSPIIIPVSERSMNQYLKDLDDYRKAKEEYDRIIADVTGTLFERKILSRIVEPLEPIDPVLSAITKEGINPGFRQNTFFVDSLHGNDCDNNGKTPVTAFQSLDKALKEATEPGSVIAMINNDEKHRVTTSLLDEPDIWVDLK